MSGWVETRGSWQGMQWARCRVTKTNALGTNHPEVNIQAVLAATPSSRPPLLKRHHSNSHRFVESISPSTEREASIPHSLSRGISQGINITIVVTVCGTFYLFLFYMMLYICFVFLLAQFDHSFFSMLILKPHIFLLTERSTFVHRQYQLPLHLHICIPLFIWVPNIYLQYLHGIYDVVTYNIKQNKNKWHNWVFVFGLKQNSHTFAVLWPESLCEIKPLNCCSVS